MKRTFCHLTAICTAVIVLTGCLVRDSFRQEQIAMKKKATAPGNQYYFYTESQLYKKKGDLKAAIEYLGKAIGLDQDSIYLKRELADLHTDNKDPEKALTVLEDILAEHPKDIETLVRYGQLNQSMKRIEQAKAAYEKALSGDPNRENLYIRLGRIYMSQENWTDAFRIYSQLTDLFPASYVGHFYLGKLHAEQGRKKDAEKAFKKTTSLAPELLEPRFELIELYRSEIGDEEKTLEIIEIYNDILKKNPQSTRGAVEFGLFYHELGRFEEAADIFEKLGKRSLSEKVVLTTIIRQYFEKEKFKEVKTALDYMLEGAPESSDLFYISGLTHNQLDQTDTAIAHFNKVDATSRFFENAVINAALIYQKRGEVDTAISKLRTAIEMAPNNLEFFLYLGTLFEEKKAYPEAEKVLNDGISLDPNSPKLHFRLGVVYDKWGRKDDCIEAMKKVIQLDPKHANALNYLGYTYADLGQNLEEAEHLIQRALAEKPNDGYITDSLGWVYYQKGLFDKALKYIQKAVDLVPDDPTILEHLGDVYLKLNNHGKAAEFYKRSLEHLKGDTSAIEKKIKEASRPESVPDE